MALRKIGLREPDDIQNTGEHAFHDDGMHYELFVDDLGDYFVAADHEDVGLVTWFRADPEDWSELCDEADEIMSWP